MIQFRININVSKTILFNVYSSSCIGLILLDLSSALEKIDHALLTDQHGIHGVFSRWFISVYLRKTFSIRNVF